MSERAIYRSERHERDYLERTIATVRNHQHADNCWPQWANIFADEIERLWRTDERLRLLEAVAEAARAYREAEKDDDEAVASIVTALDFETEKQFAAAQAVTRAAADTAYDALTDAFAALDAHEREPAE